MQAVQAFACELARNGNLTKLRLNSTRELRATEDGRLVQGKRVVEVSAHFVHRLAEKTHAAVAKGLQAQAPAGINLTTQEDHVLILGPLKDMKQLVRHFNKVRRTDPYARLTAFKFSHDLTAALGDPTNANELLDRVRMSLQSGAPGAETAITALSGVEEAKRDGNTRRLTLALKLLRGIMRGLQD